MHVRALAYIMTTSQAMIECGFHLATPGGFPLVGRALMIEPTESESKASLDMFIEAMQDIAEEAQEYPEIIVDAPHNTRISRLDETMAARKPIRAWKPQGEARKQKTFVVGYSEGLI